MTNPGRRSGNREGFAIPLALTLIVFLTVGVTTAFNRISTESRSDQDRQAKLDAFAYAQDGLEEFTINRASYGFSTMPPVAPESARITMASGHADVILQLIKPKTATRQALYLLRSRGVRTTGNVSWLPPAEHTVTQLAVFREGQMQVLSAWTSLSGVIKNGGGIASITGVDGCSVMPDIAGAAVPNNNYQQQGGAPLPTGNPPVLDLGPQSAADDSVKIDWDGIVNYNAIVPDTVLYSSTAPFPISWPTNFWPVVRVNGDYNLNIDGRGTLIVTGNLSVAGNTQFDGIMLVGGTLYANGFNNIQGAVVSGLNTKLGIHVPISDAGNGTETYQYNSCNIANAVSRFSTLVLLDKTWSDNWATW